MYPSIHPTSVNCHLVQFRVMRCWSLSQQFYTLQPLVLATVIHSAQITGDRACSKAVPLHLLLPSIPTHWECQCVLIPSKHKLYIFLSAMCITLQKLLSMNRLCLQHCPLLCWIAIRVLMLKRREAGSKTVSTQWITFRPSHRQLGADLCQAMRYTQANKGPKLWESGNIRRHKSTKNRLTGKMYFSVVMEIDPVASSQTMGEEFNCWTDSTACPFYIKNIF